MHATSLLSRPALPSAASAQQDWVVLLHGLFATRCSMRKLEERIEAAGYRVLNWGYSTWLRSTEQNVSRFLPQFETLQHDPVVRSISFVTHSMGGILARCALYAGSEIKVKRLVMLAPPNRGSHLTRISLGPFRRFIPAIAELTEAPTGLPSRLEAASQVMSSQVEIGVIAASRDFIVPIANTKLANQRDHCILRSSHFNLPNHELAIRQVLSFLQFGAFSNHPHLPPDGVNWVVRRRSTAEGPRTESPSGHGSHAMGGR